MKSYCARIRSRFSLQGELIEFIGKKSYKPKSIRLLNAEGITELKLSKFLRYSLPQDLRPGDWVQVTGQKTCRLDTNHYVLKVENYQVLLRPSSTAHPEPITASPQLSSVSFEAPPCTRILVCQKGACRKRGAVAIQQALEAEVRDRGLGDRIKVESTGCLDCCKQGPNVKITPGKIKHSQVQTPDIPALVSQCGSSLVATSQRPVPVTAVAQLTGPRTLKK